MIRADEDVERFAWQRAATVSAYVYNFGKDHGKDFRFMQPADLFPQYFPAKGPSWEERYDAAIDQEERYMEMIEKKRLRIEREAAEAARGTHGQ